jgi:transcription initiation factor TFIID subunit TAF12
MYIICIIYVPIIYHVQRFWLVSPVVGPLREWVAKVKLARRRKKKQQQQDAKQQQQDDVKRLQKQQVEILQNRTRMSSSTAIWIDGSADCLRIFNSNSAGCKSASCPKTKWRREKVTEEKEEKEETEETGEKEENASP